MSEVLTGRTKSTELTENKLNAFGTKNHLDDDGDDVDQ